MPHPLVLSVNRSLLLFGFLFLFALFPVRSLAQSPSITDVRNADNGSDYTGGRVAHRCSRSSWLAATT